MSGKSKDELTIVCLIVGLIADLGAIGVSIQIGNQLAIATLVILLLLLGVILFLYFAYTERKNFVDYIGYLFNNNVQSSNVLPKVCLRLDQTREYNDLEVTEFTVKYTYDFRTIDLANLSPDSWIEYTDSIEYGIMAKNKNIPKEFAFHLGNEYAIDEKVKIYQKHGSQTTYEAVPPPCNEHANRLSAAVQKYCWQVKPEHITSSNTFPISFLLEYNERSKANSGDVIELYPCQYAKSIDSLNFEVNICCDKPVLSNIQAFKIWKDKKTFKHTPISGVQISENQASLKLEPTCDKFEAYYLKISWKLAE